MSTAHTPEPWSVDNLGGPTEVTVTDETGFILCTVNQFAATDGDKKDEANAARIVAAVNACAGLTAEQLQQLSGGGVRRLLELTTEDTWAMFRRAALASAEGKPG